MSAEPELPTPDGRASDADLGLFLIGSAVPGSKIRRFRVSAQTKPLPLFLSIDLPHTPEADLGSESDFRLACPLP